MTHRLAVFVLLTIGFAAARAQTPKLGDVSDGSRAVPVHLLDLRDEEGTQIRLGDEPMLPFSTKETCSPCHNYDVISAGWHFNANRKEVAPGRPGHPWIYVDQISATQIPLSYRPWPGTYQPDDVGLEALRFVQLFGRQMPGGGPGEDVERVAPETFMRWWVSGKLEVNCLSCHDGEAAHDQADFASQIARQNYRWAASASSGFATVSGSAKDMPDNYSIYGSYVDDGKKIPPSVTYNEMRFNNQNKVFFDILREVPNERCYFCHSTAPVGGGHAERWITDEDVHLAAGMQCIDCHRNGLDHMMVRGYEGEAAQTRKPEIASLTCRGCHLPDEDAEAPHNGRLGAPVPKHAGIPVIHFETLTCTACHSGVWPKENTPMVKTSQGHGLGTHGVNRSQSALPHIQSPVFVEDASGKIAPHNMVWPAFWAQIDSGEVSPLAPEKVRPIAMNLVERDTLGTGDWPAMHADQITEILQTLTKQDSGAAQANYGYVSGGLLFTLDKNGKLASTKHNAAKPYSWAIGHNVRPAAQSLGVRGCKDCHALDAPFYFAKVTTDAPLRSLRENNKKMVEFAGLSGFYARIFAASFYLRPLLKMIILVATIVLGLILLLFVFKGLSAVLENKR